MILKRKLTKKKKIVLTVVCTGAGIILILPAVIVFLLTRTPAYYKPLEPPNRVEVSPYLTNYIAPEIHNKSQLGEPFELVITEAGLNDIIARGPWPMTSGIASVTLPAARLSEGRAVLMATIKYGPASAIWTATMNPSIDESGLLCVNLEKITAGALEVTGFAKKAIEEIISANAGKIDTTWADNISAALLENKPFEPVFTAYENEVQLTGIDISDGKAVLRLSPQAKR
ncbi:MAG: hypothetical protein DRP65_03275 [Planctomycetota bacterium]|nr:MAG: hypothetical protein DRP65_03275 [Planctomycetota bacterium]